MSQALTETKHAAAKDINDSKPMVCVIHSLLPLDEIHKYCDGRILAEAKSIEEIKSGQHVCSMLRVLYKKVLEKKTCYVSTNRAICSMKREYFKILASENKDTSYEKDFKIVEYNFYPKTRPHHGFCYELYVSLPLDYLDLESCKKQLNNRLQDVIKCGYIEKNQYTWWFPFTSRESNVPSQPRKYCLITFDEKVSERTRNSIRVLLDQTKWSLEKSTDLPSRVSWAKEESVKAVASNVKIMSGGRYRYSGGNRGSGGTRGSGRTRGSFKRRGGVENRSRFGPGETRGMYREKKTNVPEEKKA